MIENFKDICIIDDDAISVFGLKRALKKYCLQCDVEPAVFENGLDAIENFQDRFSQSKPLPLLIFIDLNMPVMSGWDFIDEFREHFSTYEPQPKIFIMSSSINPEDYERAQSYGLGDNYLTKPISKETLENAFAN